MKNICKLFLYEIFSMNQNFNVHHNQSLSLAQQDTNHSTCSLKAPVSYKNKTTHSTWFVITFESITKANLTECYFEDQLSIKLVILGKISTCRIYFCIFPIISKPTSQIWFIQKPNMRQLKWFSNYLLWSQSSVIYTFQGYSH